jgi:putative tricarboxylic transport membrane protein
VTYLIGGVGLAMRRMSMPLAPAVIALILGPLAEQQFRRAVAIGGPAIFFARPISAGLLISAVLVVVVPFVRKWISDAPSAEL